MHLAISGAHADTAQNDTNEAEFRTRPEARSSNRWINTNQIEGADYYDLLGLETVVNVGPVQFVGEYQSVWVNRDFGGNDVNFNGGYFYVSYFLTGDIWDENQERWQGLFLSTISGWSIAAMDVAKRAEVLGKSPLGTPKPITRTTMSSAELVSLSRSDLTGTGIQTHVCSSTTSMARSTIEPSMEHLMCSVIMTFTVYAGWSTSKPYHHRLNIQKPGPILRIRRESNQKERLLP